MGSLRTLKYGLKRYFKTMAGVDIDNKGFSETKMCPLYKSRHVLWEPSATDLDRGPLAKIISFRGTHLGNTWFMVYLKDI